MKNTAIQNCLLIVSCIKIIIKKKLISEEVHVLINLFQLRNGFKSYDKKCISLLHFCNINFTRPVLKTKTKLRDSNEKIRCKSILCAR